MITIDLLNRKSKAQAAKSAIRLNEVVRTIHRSKKATIITGAGISCNAGIPDFRSGDGLYNLVKEKYPKSVVKGQDLFDVSLFRDEASLSVFCTFMEGLYQSSREASPTETHRFIKTMKEKDKLLRCYTQNIDSLEASINLNIGVNVADFADQKSFANTWRNLDVVQLHGNLHKLSCTICFHTVDWTSEYQRELAAGLNPKCEKCQEKYIERLYAGKRITNTVGILRPDIVLYGENHPQSEILTQGLNVDLKARPDLLIVMGTSLKVDGVKKLVKSLSKSVREKGGKVLFVNKTPLAKQWESFFDYEVIADCDSFVRVLKKEIPDLFLTQEQLDSKRLIGKKRKIKEEIKEEEEEEEGIKEEIKEELQQEVSIGGRRLRANVRRVKTEVTKRAPVQSKTKQPNRAKTPATKPEATKAKTKPKTAATKSVHVKIEQDQDKVKRNVKAKQSKTASAPRVKIEPSDKVPVSKRPSRARTSVQVKREASDEIPRDLKRARTRPLSQRRKLATGRKSGSAIRGDIS